MYNLITNLLQKEYSVDMSSNSMYNQFFETNFMNTFKDVETEDIKDLNKHLLDTQLDYYQNFISKHTSGETSKEGESSKGTIKEDKEPISDSSNGENTVIYSLQRIINFQLSNRYSYRIQNKIKKASADEVKNYTGFSIGGVAPIGHLNTPTKILIDINLKRFDKQFTKLCHN